MWGRQAEHIVVERGRNRGREAEQEAVECEVMEAAPDQSEAVIGLVAAVAVSAVEVGESQGVPRRLGKRRQPSARIA